MGSWKKGKTQRFEAGKEISTQTQPGCCGAQAAAEPGLWCHGPTGSMGMDLSAAPSPLCSLAGGFCLPGACRHIPASQFLSPFPLPHFLCSGQTHFPSAVAGGDVAVPWADPCLMHLAPRPRAGTSPGQDASARRAGGRCWVLGTVLRQEAGGRGGAALGAVRLKLPLPLP